MVNGDFDNSNNASFVMGSDLLMVAGDLTNSAIFNGNSGAIVVSGDLNNNTAGNFTAGTGNLSIDGSLTNNATYTAGSGTIQVNSDFTNSGTFNNSTGSLTIGNNFNNASGGAFSASSGTINLSGNLINQGTFDDQTSTVNFNSSVTRSISGNTTDFFNLTKSGGGSVSLASTVIVQNLLTLNNGRIITGTNNLRLTNRAIQPVVGYSTNNFVDGRLVISYPDNAGASRVFPVGKENTYRPVSIMQTEASFNPRVRVEMINEAPEGTFDPTLSEISGARYYKVDLVSGTMNSPVIELSFNTSGTADEPVATPGNLRVARSITPNGPWTDEEGTGVFSPASPAGYVTSLATSIQFPTYFSLAYTEEVLLPITLLSFKGEFVEHVVHLNWSTINEKGNDYFTIERSSDGKLFDSLFTIEGAGDSNKLLKYIATDYRPLSGKSYYRLKQTDFDGAFSYSKIISITNESPIAFKVVPNPSRGDRLTVQVEGAKAGQEFIMTIFDLRGNILMEQAFSSYGAFENIEVKPNRVLSPGIFIIKITTGVGSVTEKIIVEL